MSVSVTITFDTLEAAILQLAKLRNSDAKVEAAPNAAPAPSTKPKKGADAPPSADSAAKTDAPAPPPPASTGPSYDDVAKAVSTVASKDRQRAVDALAKFGATNAKGLKPEQYAEFLEVLTAKPKEEESLT